MSRRKFTGRIGRCVAETEYAYENIPSNRRADAPNVLYIVLDDLGFAQLGCYGSNIDTPNIDRLAENGLRYNNFHTTAICSATRASLLTGANHHSVGVNATVEMVTGCSNGAGEIDKSYATLAEILREFDYDTYACGKWHLANMKEVREVGPFDNWPLGKGFENYYGFLASNNSQWNPTLTVDNTMIDQPKSAEDGYHFSEDVTDHAIHYISNQKNAYPDKPFFLYLAYGAMHTPHHAPKEYIDKYKGWFDEGWDVLREQWFAKQKELGVIPQDAALNPRNRLVKPWDSLSDFQKKVYAKYMEAFAGMLDHTDAQIGRVLDYLEKIGQLDNTVVVLVSDNGATSEGGPNGRLNISDGCNSVSVSDTEEEMAEFVDKIGSVETQNAYPEGWGNLGNTPFQWYKTWAHAGGVRDPLIISYPKEIKDKGSVRSQYHHVIDITPTILDIIGIEKPDMIKGVPQKPMQGISLRYTFGDADAKDRRTVQYFEMLGNRAIYKDGWRAVVDHTFNDSYDQDEWELYHIEEDFSECYNVADKYPEKLHELQEEWLIEASKYGVFPMHNNSCTGKADAYSLGNLASFPERTYEYHYIDRYFELVEKPILYGNSFSLRFDIERDSIQDEGVLYSYGDRYGGFVLYIIDNQLKFVLNHGGKKTTKMVADKELQPGSLSVKLDVRRSGEKAGIISIYLDGEKVIEKVVENYIYGELMGNLYHTIGADKQSTVSDEYSSPFIFSGNINYAKIRTAETKISSESLLDEFFDVD